MALTLSNSHILDTKPIQKCWPTLRICRCTGIQSGPKTVPWAVLGSGRRKTCSLSAYQSYKLHSKPKLTHIRSLQQQFKNRSFDNYLVLSCEIVRLHSTRVHSGPITPFYITSQCNNDQLTLMFLVYTFAHTGS